MIELKIIAALLRDVSNAHGLVFNTRAARLTLARVEGRLRTEGIGFLTVAMPRLAKAFDRAIAGGTPLNSVKQGFETLKGSELPMFMGEFFKQVLDKDGTLLPNPCPKSVRVIRELLYLLYKYELPYTDEQEQKVISAFKQAENEIRTFTPMLDRLQRWFDETTSVHAAHRRYARNRQKATGSHRCHEHGTFRAYGETHEAPCPACWPTGPSRDESVCVDDGNPLSGFPCERGSVCKNTGLSWEDILLLPNVRRARALLQRLFHVFDPLDIYPRHGPGVVATKQQLWGKYVWTNVSTAITDLYPFDAYFCASVGHVCDTYDRIHDLRSESLSARVILVPKDSRGPRLISCEPVDYQWVQQGLGRAIVRLVESHPLTKWNVFFTDQAPNQRGALLGSINGKYVTLDLKEASDRISLDLVRLLFPSKIVNYLEACRTSSTVLPDGSVLKLQKYAPMGSCLCFPILALTVWAILSAAAPDEDAREGILVYGDDVIVPKAQASNAIEQLEVFGLQVNRNKSCTSGLFRESCGTDAFQGVNVTPIRLRTVWSSTPSAKAYTSWIAIANSFYDRQYYQVYNTIVEELEAIYGPIPDESLLGDRIPSLREAPEYHGMFRRRWNRDLQKHEYRVRVVHTPPIKHEMSGWDMLLRYFTEKGNPGNQANARSSGKWSSEDSFLPESNMSVRLYTRRDTSKLVWRWR